MPPARSRPKAPEPPASLDELAAFVRSLLPRAPGMRAADLKKALPKNWKAQHAEALSILRELASKGEAHRFAKGRVERFFADDPVAALDRAVPELLSNEGPLGAADLKKAVERALRGHGDLVAEWLKSALSRRKVFVHAKPPKARTARYGHEPDLGLLLAKTLAELKKAMVEVDGAGVPRARALDRIAQELGIEATSPPREKAVPMSNTIERKPASDAGPPRADREIVRDALLGLAREHRPGTLLLVEVLRARTPLDKERFDAAALALARDGLAVLHHHDHAALLSDDERRELVADGRGTHYIGIAPRDTA